MFKFKRLQILLHILAWAILLCGPLIGRDFIHTTLLIKSIIHTVVLAGLFYFNTYILIPHFLFGKKIGLFVLFLFLTVIIAIVCNYFFDQWLLDQYPGEFRIVYRFNHPPPFPDPHSPITINRFLFPFRIFPSVLSTLFVVGISTSLKVVNEYLKKEKQQKEIENEKLNSELAFLRYQINPHFLFNTLNNIYSLVQAEAKNVDQAILKLSELMRYMLADTERKEVPLKKEIQYVQSYLELQKLRIHKSVTIDINIKVEETNLMIEPLLLIPFIENAFKHGISYTQNSYISINIEEEENKIILHVENSIPKIKIERDNTSGIGLVNVKKRLHLLYPGKHTLFIRTIEDRFVVHLVVDL